MQKLLGFLPVIFVHALLAWSYYAYVGVLVAQTMESTWVKGLLPRVGRLHDASNQKSCAVYRGLRLLLAQPDFSCSPFLSGQPPCSSLNTNINYTVAAVCLLLYHLLVLMLLWSYWRTITTSPEGPPPTVRQR